MAISVSQAFKDRFKAAVDRSLFKVEVYFSVGLGWVDITSYVKSMSGTMEEVSSLTGGTSANSLSLVLINMDGRFSRKNASGPYYAAGLGLVPNKPVRVSAVYGSESVRLFTGNTGPWNTNAKNRTCSVQAQDAARLLRTREVAEEVLMDPANPSQGYYLTPVLERAAWLAGLRWDAVNTKAAEWTFTSHDGTSITPTYDAGAARAVYTQGGVLVMTLDLVDLRLPVAHLKGKGLELISKLAEVVDGKVYFDGQGQLVFRARMYRNDSTLVSVETFTVSNLDDVTAQANFEQSQFAPLINKATVKASPLTPWLDEAGNWSEREIVISTFEKATFTSSEVYPGASDPDLFLEVPDGFRLHRTTSPVYPTAANMSVRSVDPNDPTRDLGGITLSGSPTFFASSIKLKLVNNGAGTEALASISIRSKLFQAKQGCRGVAENADSQAFYGQRADEISNDFIPNVAACNSLASWTVENGREVKDHLTLPVMHGLPWMEINDKITVSETITNSVPVAEDFIVKRIPWSWTMGVFAFAIEACTPSPTFSVGSLPPTAAITETANVNLSASVKGGLPPQVIDGTQALVGLNNVPAFANLVGGVKKITTLPSTTTNKDIIFDGSDIFACDTGSATGRSIHKVDPMTGSLIASKAFPVGGTQINGLAIGVDGSGNRLIFASDPLNGKIFVIPIATFDSGAWATKSTVTSIRGVLTANGKMIAFTTVGGPHIKVWNDISSTTDDTPDVSIKIQDTIDSIYQTATDGRYVYACIHDSLKIIRYDTVSETVDANFIQLASGEKPTGVAHDGQNVWVAVGTVPGSCKLLRFRETPAGIVRDPVEAPIGIYGRLMFDGTYIWVVSRGTLLQISPSGGVIATYQTGTGFDGSGAFDGAAIWFTGGDRNLYRVPRIVSGRQF